MDLSSASPPVILAGLALGWAAAEDLGRRIIPDTVPVLLVVLGIAPPVVHGAVPWSAIGAALVTFLALAWMHGRGWLGGGDVKLAAALVLLVGADDAAGFIMATALAGGVLSVVYAGGCLIARRLGLVRRLLRRFGPRRRLGGPARLLVEEVHRIATRHSVPYGVALAAGGMLALTNPSGGVAWP
ncbi:hypothetical protein VY88_30365 [Azospirillum thiophilum]|uniref:Prepilin type IV endopeptidase peptidase domain-containing protein n=1 Tax=Azospirillum thiophilum TaxID=528244 RepID=A0AAC8ZVW6_9PROT|nr:A24 family peptidase [Azospirillum thiophilum]ALG74530.1 hypothetical protein AL072_26270 [Azospirillum thiophilum]KJR61703.1 hypothetical protein VY88_30365 [Azospirillum thiophilum]